MHQPPRRVGPRVCGRDEGPSPRTERSESVNNGLDGAADVTLDLFATCAQSSDGDRETYVRRVADVARWSERVGCKGILVYSDNRLVDPWLVSHVIIQDRKSTRLNSSHTVISYAVFCLKKKKEK